MWNARGETPFDLSRAPDQKTNMSPRTVDVLLPLGLDAAYSYLLPEGMEVSPGDLVHVPLGTKSVIGVVWPPEGRAPLVVTAFLTEGSPQGARREAALAAVGAALAG